MGACLKKKKKKKKRRHHHITIMLAVLRNYSINNKIKVCSLLVGSPLIYPQQLYTLFPCFSTLSNTHFQPPSLQRSHFGKLVFSNYFNPKLDHFSLTNASLTHLILTISHVSPPTARKCLRFSAWKPEDLHFLLLGFHSGIQDSGFDAKIVDCLWEIFKRVGHYNDSFNYLPASVEVMASMFINVGNIMEAQSLLSAAEIRGIFLPSKEIFAGLIEGYVNRAELQRAVFMYDKIKGQNLVLPISCYRSIIHVLIKECRVDYVISVYEDMVKAGFEFGDVETRNLETLIGVLCWDGKINDARKLVRKIVANGWKPSRVILSEIANVYCEKRDFDDLLNFFAEMNCAPDILVGNKVIHQLCNIFGTHRADWFLWELEQLGFSPNEITFGILIGFCCRDKKLRDAFCYLSEIFARGLKPDRHSYNAVISSLFQVGMKEHARDILNDMIDNGIKPDIATYRTLLAGYCKARQFNEVKLLIKEMASCGLVLLSPSEDPICKAFHVLGLDPMTVRVKRDNDLRNFRTEYIDELGNGLYLDADMEEFEKTVAGILKDSLVPDFSLLVMRQCGTENLIEIVLKLHEMALWGQELIVPFLSELVRLFSNSNCHTKTIPGLLDANTSQFFNKLDHVTLNMLIQALSKKGCLDKCSQLFDEMHLRRLPITQSTYNSVLIALCKLGRLTGVRDCWDLLSKGLWFPEWRDFLVLLDFFCSKRMLKELFELFDMMITSNPNSLMQICDAFLQKLCSTGFTSVGHMLISELRQNYELDDLFYSQLILGYSEEKRFTEALIIYDTFLAENNLTMSSEAILTLVALLCKANRFEHALALKARGLIEYPSISCSIFSALLDGYCKIGRVSEADDLILEMLSINILPSAEIYNTLLQGHCKICDLKTSSKLLCSMIRRRISLTLSSYKDLMFLFCRKRLFHSVWGLKILMLLEKFPHSVIYNTFIFYLFRTGNHTQVNALLDELDRTGPKLDEVGHNFLVHGFSVNGNIQRSLAYFNDLMMKGLRPTNRSLRAIIRYLCNNGKVQNAFELYNEVESKGWNVSSTVQYTLLQSLLDDGRIIEAEMCLSPILEKCLFSDTINYNNLVRKFGQYGKLETSVNLLDQIVKDRSIPDPSSYDCIVQRFCEYDNLDCAMDFLAEMLCRTLKPSLYTWDLLINKFCIKGHTATAEGILLSMSKVDEIPTKRMYSSVINRYRLENNLSKASELLQKMQQHGYEPDFSTQWSLISSLSNSGEPQGGYGSQGFLSRLLGGSGFLAGGRTKSKQE
ncbi:pentatricopeptide repeat-containing protein At5g15280, mitochondrial [Silene latifolia]|uniref:pentatricopeptide repeat-containing protein At5g15280, mitochondrial n=1 Tax=Silene latifolia TaxID=37657 RepID=UPI003D76AB7E